MKVSPPFRLRKQHTSKILDLLESVTLGSNGTLYRHKQTKERIEGLYRPLYLSLERNEKVIANVTFCRRPNHWYVRYFAFESKIQAAVSKPPSKGRNSMLKNTILQFFEDALSQPEVETLYAYIDPRNERSLWMSQTFGFTTIAKIATQTFSRLNPKKQSNVHIIPTDLFVKEKVKSTYENHPFYFDGQTFNPSPFYGLEKDGKIVAFAKTHRETWEMIRLPGKRGGLLTKIIPYIPFVRKLIHPPHHEFTVIDTVWSETNNAEDLEQLFEGILAGEKTHSLIWWVDQKESIYTSVKNNIKWGLMHKINGVNEVDLVVKSTVSLYQKKLPTASYITGYDFI